MSASPLSPQDAMQAVIRAAKRVQSGRWVRGGALTHVLADFMSALRADGFGLVRL